MALAVALDCSFVARGYAGDHEHLKGLIKAAVNHKGFSLVDIFQPCVTFNKVNTYAWYSQRVYHIEPDYNPKTAFWLFRRPSNGETEFLSVLFTATIDLPLKNGCRL